MAKSEIEIRMEQERCMDAINEAIGEVEAQLNELGDLGSEALEAGDQGLVDQVMESICFYSEQLTSLKSLKVNTKLQVVTSHISNTMVKVLSTVGNTSAGMKMPNTKKLMKIQKQLAMNTATSRQARKEISGIMRNSSPAKSFLSPEQKAQAMMFIQSRSVSKTGSLSGASSELWDKVNEEKNMRL